ncbi:MAG TPA: MarR family transcriptional regulator [Actinocrinis sp.]|nr:MarR family transcriptional regulator [Actinocrinis sp.]
MPSTNLAVSPNQSSTPTAPADEAPAPAEGHLTDVVSRLRRVLRTGLQAEYTWESLPMPHVEILHILAEQPGIQVGDVAVELRLAQPAVCALLRQMAADGLVEQTPEAAGRPAVLVSLTQAGADQLAGWQTAHRQRISAALNKLATDDLSQL